MATLLVATVVGEFCWRTLGYRPNVSDSPALWTYWFNRALTGGPRTIALIGASRIQAGVSAAQLHSRLPGYRVVQLGQYAGGSPIGVLRALAADSRFNGIVICDTLAPFLVREKWDDQSRDLKSGPGPRFQLSAIASAYVCDQLALKNSETGIFETLRKLINEGDLPAPDYLRMRASRCLELRFTDLENLTQFTEKKLAAFQRTYRSANRLTPQNLEDEYEEINGFVHHIQAHGGQVVFLTMPSSGGRLELEEEYHSKLDYWDRFASTSSGICIHFTELAGGNDFTCPDDSHLDYLAAVRFTNVLTDELLRRSVVAVQAD